MCRINQNFRENYEMRLYTRDYCKQPTLAERQEYNDIRNEEKEGRPSFGRKNLYYRYPEAIRHHNSLFPNNHIELLDWKNSGRMVELTEEFSRIVHDKNTTEREILNYINHKPAYYIIGALLIHKNFGHHGTYIFPEFSIGNGMYFADYLVVGKGSGGYEFVFVELEAPNKRTTIKSGHAGQATRSGLCQIFDWKRQIAGNYISITNEFKKSCLNADSLPQEFLQYDPTRMHYMTITGLRDDYNDVTYCDRRAMAKENGIEVYHYDNLIDFSKLLEEKNTF